MKENKLRYWWYVWMKAVGDRAHINIKIADHVAVLRTLIVLVYLVTNAFIIAGVLHHW